MSGNRRVVAAVVLAVLAAGALLVHAAAAAVVVGVVSILCADELFRVLRARGVHPVPVGAFVGLAALIALGYGRGERGASMIPIAIAGAFFITVVVAMLRRGVEGSAAALQATTFTVVYAGALPAYVAVLLAMPHGRALALGLWILVLANGVVAGGVAILRRRGGRGGSTALGIAAGTAATVGAGALLGVVLAPPFSIGRGLVLAGVVAIAAPAGHRVGLMIVAESPSERRERPPVLLPILNGLIISAPLFFYAYRALIT